MSDAPEYSIKQLFNVLWPKDSPHPTCFGVSRSDWLNRIVTLDEPTAPAPEQIEADPKVRDMIAFTIAKQCREKTEGEWEPSIRQSVDMADAILAALAQFNPEKETT